VALGAGGVGGRLGTRRGTAPVNTLFPNEPECALRQPKTDRLVVARFLNVVAKDNRLDEDELRQAHQVILKWADFDSSGRLAKQKETQLQGEFLADVFGAALGYAGPVEASDKGWHRQQHHQIAGEEPDAILGFFRKDEAYRPLAVVELKGPKIHLDRDRSNGRTAVDQCWDYDADISHFVCFKDVTSPTNQRTMIAAFTPLAGVVNSAPIVLSEAEALRQTCLLGNLNSFAYDFVVRQKISNVHLNFFIVEQVPTLPPDTYDKPCPWEHRTTLQQWISGRVLKLTCTAEDMLPLAEACDFTGGSFQTEYGGRLHKWDEAERAELMAQLDAAYFHLYGLDRHDVEYILSTFKGIHDERTLFPGNVTTAQRIVQLFAEMSFPG